MKVRSTLAPSYIRGKGMGVFSREQIPARAEVFAWNPQIDSEYSSILPDSWTPDELEEFIALASWDGEVWSLAGDNGAYFNHSDDPNVVVVPQPGVRPARWKRVASRRIQAGEEMTMDYSQVGTDVPR